MDLETAKSLLADDLDAMQQEGPPQAQQQQPPRRQGKIPKPQTVELPGAGIDPGQFNFGPTGDLEKYQAWRSSLPWPAQMALPSDMPEAMGIAATGGMGPEIAAGARAGRMGWRVARRFLPRLGLATAAGGLGAKMEGTPVLGGALKGGVIGTTSEGIYAGQRAWGTSRLGNYLRDEIPRRLSAVTQRHAPWVPEFRTPGEFVHVVNQIRRGDTGAQNRISALWDREMDGIETELGRRSPIGTRLVTRWNPGDPIVGDIRAPGNWREALQAIDELGETGFQEGLPKSGVPASRAIRAREELIDEVGQHLERVGGPQLRQRWEAARDQYGRAKGVLNLYGQPGVVTKGRLNRDVLQQAWIEMSQKGLDLDAKWRPGELDELEHALFGGNEPTATDIGGKPLRLRTTLPKGHIFGDMPQMPVFQGERPLMPYTSPQFTHLATQAGMRAATGKVRQPQPDQTQDVVMPDTPGAVPPETVRLPPEILTLIKAHPDLQGMSEEELQALYQQVSAQQ